MGGTLEPAARAPGQRARCSRPAACSSASRPAGIVGFMGRNVLGQYELALLDPDAPAAAAARRAQPARGRAHLRGRRGRAARSGSSSTRSPTRCSSRASRGCASTSPRCCASCSSSVKVEVDPAALLRLPKLAATCARLWDAVREGGLVHAVAGPERKEIIDRLQAVDGAHRGPRRARDGRRRRRRRCPSLPKLRESLERRRREKPPLVKLLERLLGLDLKMRQYEVGKRFCDAVVARLGDRGPQPRLERRRSSCRRSPSSTTRPPGCAQNTCSFCNTAAPSGLQTCVRVVRF